MAATQSITPLTDENGISLVLPTSDQVLSIEKGLRAELEKLSDVNFQTCTKLVSEVYPTNGLELPQYHAGIVGALMDMKSPSFPSDKTSTITEGVKIFDNFRALSEKYNIPLSEITEYIDAISHKAKLPSENLLAIVETMVWFNNCAAETFVGIPPNGENTLGDFVSALQKSLVILDPKLEFNFSRFGSEDDILNRRHLQMITSAIDEEVQLPRGLFQSQHAIVRDESQIKTPAGREVTLYDVASLVDKPVLSAVQSQFILRDSAAITRSVDMLFNHEESLDPINSFLIQQIYPTIASTQDDFTRLCLEKDTYYLGSGNDLEKAAEALLKRRLLESRDRDADFLLTNFFKNSDCTVDFKFLSDKATSFAMARSQLMTIKHTEHPLLDFNKDLFSVSDIANLNKSSIIVFDLLFQNLDDIELLKAWEAYRDAHKEFVYSDDDIFQDWGNNATDYGLLVSAKLKQSPRVFQSLIAKQKAFMKVLIARLAPEDDSSTKIDKFSAQLKTAASKALEAFTYEDLDKVPEMPTNWKEMKVDWAPASAA